MRACPADHKEVSSMAAFIQVHWNTESGIWAQVSGKFWRSGTG